MTPFLHVCSQFPLCHLIARVCVCAISQHYYDSGHSFLMPLLVVCFDNNVTPGVQLLPVCKVVFVLL